MEYNDFITDFIVINAGQMLQEGAWDAQFVHLDFKVGRGEAWK